MKGFESSLLSKELKVQTNISKKKKEKKERKTIWKIRIYDFDEKLNKNDEKPTLKNFSKSDLINDANHVFS